MSINGMFGSHMVPTRVWRPRIEISMDGVGMQPPDEYTVDPYLPTIAVDPFDPAASIVVPSGRFVSVGYVGGRGGANYRMAYTDSGKTVLTLADGRNMTPAGMSIHQLYKENNQFFTDSNTANFKKWFMAEVPFITSINNSQGTLYSGDRLAAYWGSTTSETNVAGLHRGKPVKWVSKKVFCVTSSSSSMVILEDSLNVPGIKPRVIKQFASGTAVAPTAAVSWDATLGKWLVSNTGTGSAVTEVWFESGQDEDQIAGEVVRIQGLSDILTRDDFLKWVEYDSPMDTMNYPPAMQRMPVTPVSNESSAVSNGRVTLTYKPISVHHPVVVEVTNAAIIDQSTGSVTATYTGGSYYTLPNSTMLDARNYFVGNYHNVNWRTGVIEFAGNIVAYGGTLTARVTYSYISDAREGAVIWGAGVLGLTDGRNVNTLGSTKPYGVPSHLNLPDVVAALRLIVH